MRIWIYRALLAPLLLSTLLPNTTQAASWDPLPPELVAIEDCPREPGCYAAVLLQEALLDNEYARAHVTHHRVVKIFKADGLDAATIKIPYVVGQWHISELQGRTIRPDGTVVDLDPSSAREQTATKRRRYRSKVITFDMPAAEVGAVLEYRYTVIRQYRIGSYTWEVQEGIPVLQASLTLVPGEIAMTPRLLAPQGVRVTQDEDEKGRGRINMLNISSFKDEPFSPPDWEVRTKLFLYPSNPWWTLAGSGSGYEEHLKKYFKRSSKTRKLVKQIVGEATDPEVKLERIYRWIQDNLDNTSYRETTEGEEEQEERNLYVDDVILAGQGSRVDLTKVFIYLARQAGLDAAGALVAERDTFFFDPSIFVRSDLNSLAGAVKLNGSWEFFDPGTRYCPFRMVGWEKEGVGDNAVVTREGGGVLARVPMSRAADNLSHRSLRIQLEPEGGMSAEVELEVHGLAGAEMRNALDHRTAEERRTDLEESLEEEFGGVELEDLEYPNFDAWTEPLQVRYQFRADEFAAAAGSRMLVPAAPFHSDSVNPFSATVRNYPIYFRRTYKNVDDVTIQIPEGFEVESLPTRRKSDIQALRYEIQFEQEPGEIRVNREMMVDILLVEPPQYRTIRRLYGVRAQADGSQIILRKTGEPEAADAPAADAEEGR